MNNHVLELFKQQRERMERAALEYEPFHKTPEQFFLLTRKVYCLYSYTQMRYIRIEYTDHGQEHVEEL